MSAATLSRQPVILRKQHGFTPTHGLQGRNQAVLRLPRGQGGTLEQAGTEPRSTLKGLILQGNMVTGTLEQENPHTMRSRAHTRHIHVPMFQCSKGVKQERNHKVSAEFAGTALCSIVPAIKNGGDNGQG